MPSPEDSIKVLVIGSGGREHALCWKIAQSPLVEEVICAPGNAGISGVARLARVDPNDADAVLAEVGDEPTVVLG